jgi:hypothetical protein
VVADGQAPEGTEEDGLVAEEEMRPDTTGLYCFLNDERVCGAECMAFITFPKQSDNSELGKQQAHCALLNNADRLGRNVVIAVSMLARAEKKKRSAEADQKRSNQFDPHKHGPVAVSPDKSPFGEKP